MRELNFANMLVTTMNCFYSSGSDHKEKMENQKAVLGWKGPTKETLSSRLRREMNAGKGVGFLFQNISCYKYFFVLKISASKFLIKYVYIYISYFPNFL